MTRATPRLRWQKALRSAQVPASFRVVRGTLLALVDELAPTGELCVRREKLEDATGLPTRTLERHLQRAVEAGWLVRTVPGGNGRRAVYETAIPESCPPFVADKARELPAVYSRATPGSCPPSGGGLNKKSANDSERVAVNDQRGRRRTPVGSGVSATDYLRKSSSYRSGQPTPVTSLSFVREVGAA